jgi:hypothetical protein
MPSSGYGTRNGSEHSGTARGDEVALPRPFPNLTAVCPSVSTASWTRRTLRARRGAQVAAIPTTGLLRWMAPVEPKNVASPYVKMPPSVATNQ